MRRQFVLGLFSALFLVPAAAGALPFEIAVGAKGGMNGSAVRGVPEGDPYTIDGTEYPGLVQGPDLYPMFGLGGGFGGFLEFRFFDIVGLESGVHLSYDNGNGWEDKNGPGGQTIGRVDQEQRTTALHIPIMAKAAVPGFVRPTFGLGVEIIKQNKSELTYRSDVFDVSPFETYYTIEPSTYTTLAFSFALEVDLGEVRIPIELRGNYNVGFRKDLDERAVASGNPLRPSFQYDGEYEGHFALYTGIIYGFDIEL
jgi:hypothetical protein